MNFVGRSGPCSVQKGQRESSSYTLEVLKERLRPRDAVQTTTRGYEYAVSDAVAPNVPCHVPNGDIVSECGQSELPRPIHSDEKADHDPFFVQPCVKEVVNAQCATPQKPVISMSGKEPLRRLKLHRQNHTKCTHFGPCKKNVFHRLCLLKTDY